MDVAIGFLAGLFIGGFCGVFFTALVVAASREEEDDPWSG